jgi:sugar phosphate isomerase/epimerase
MAIPKFGRITSSKENVLKEIEIAAKLGFDFVEIGIEGPGGSPEFLLKNKKKILTLLHNNGLFGIAHTSWWFELGSAYENVRRGWIEEGKRTILTANELEMGMINFHTLSNGFFLSVPSAKKHVLDNFVLSMKELVDYGKSLGLKVVVENLSGRSSLGKPEDIKYVTDRVKELGFLLDVGHAHISGGMKEVMDFIRIFRPKLWHVHMHDNHGQGDEHLPLGSSKLEYEKVVSALKRIGYDKTITLEVFCKDVDYAQYSMNKLKKLWLGK